MEEAGEGEKARWALHSERVGPPRATHRQDLPSANREGMCLDERFPPPLCPRREELLCLLAFPFVPCQVLAAHEIDTSLGLVCFHSSNVAVTSAHLLIPSPKGWVGFCLDCGLTPLYPGGCKFKQFLFRGWPVILEHPDWHSWWSSGVPGVALCLCVATAALWGPTRVAAKVGAQSPVNRAGGRGDGQATTQVTPIPTPLLFVPFNTQQEAPLPP